LHLNSELFVCDTVKSGGVDLSLLLGGDLGQYNWSISELGSVVNSSVFSIGGGSSGFDNGSIFQGMDTFFNDHVRDCLGVMILLLVWILLDGEFEGGSSNVLDSHGDWLATVHTEWTQDHDWSVELASDWHLEPFGSWSFLE